MGEGASLGKEAVLADSGREGEVVARVGQVRCRAFPNSLRGMKAAPAQTRLRVTSSCKFVNKPLGP